MTQPALSAGTTTVGGCSVARAPDGRYFWSCWTVAGGERGGEAKSEAEAWAQAYSAALDRQEKR